jgi:Zn-dependent protease-like protein
MKKIFTFALALAACICVVNLWSCSNKQKSAQPAAEQDEACADSMPCCPPLGYHVDFQPLGIFSRKEAEELRTEFVKQLQLLYRDYTKAEIEASVFVNENKPIPASCYYQPRGRYRAGDILKWLQQENGGDPEVVTIGVTNSDISTSIHGKKDYGIMGLSLRPGGACVVSTYRLKRKDDLWKVTLHEFLHSRGLPHCRKDNPTCIMQDAHGKNTFYKKHGLCADCKKALVRR